MKTKTAAIAKEVLKNTYKQQPQTTILRTTKHECGKNYKGTVSDICDLCTSEDDKTHCLYYCPKWKNVILYDCTHKVNFEDVYSNSSGTVRKVASLIKKIYNTRLNGSMRP